MDVFEAIETRCSVRAYRTDPVSDDDLAKVLEAARLAPTAANRQPFRVVVFHTEGRTADAARIYDRKWIQDAPVLLTVVAVPDEAWVRGDGRLFVDVDVAIVMDHIVLAATALGLGTCWVADFDPAATREILGLPDDVEPVVLTPLGHPDTARKRNSRRPLEELVKYERW